MSNRAAWLLAQAIRCALTRNSGVDRVHKPPQPQTDVSSFSPSSSTSLSLIHVCVCVCVCVCACVCACVCVYCVATFALCSWLPLVQASTLFCCCQPRHSRRCLKPRRPIVTRWSAWPSATAHTTWQQVIGGGVGELVFDGASKQGESVCACARACACACVCVRVCVQGGERRVWGRKR